jgi:uncharacterized lipoprotein YddW (UPF0748 family)
MKKLLPVIATAAAASVLAASLAHADVSSVAPKRELRGVWISTHLSLDWPNRTQTPEQQRAALAAILDHNVATGMNAAFLQLRSQSDAMYPSELEPWSYYLTNNQGSAPAPSWDPLQFAIAESRKRGLEFHAWINPYRAVANTATESNTAQYAANHVSRTHPEWMLTVGTVKILNPGLAAVREHVTKVIMDIVERYDVDGIHFDDYFYPAGTINDDAAYAADPRGFPATAAGRADWRRDNINLLIAGVGERIRAVKPWIKFGVSPSGIYRSSTDPAVGSPTSAGASQHFVTNFAVEGVGRQARQRGLADAGRAPQDHRMRFAGFENQVQRLSRSQQVALADDFVDGARAQGFGQRGGGFVLEEVIHGGLPVRLRARQQSAKCCTCG